MVFRRHNGRRGQADGGPTIAERVATMRGRPTPSATGPDGAREYPWSYIPVPPLPSLDELPEVAGEALRALLPVGKGAVRSLAECFAEGFAAFAVASNEGTADVPAWFLEADALDPLDVLFLGAFWPVQVPDPVLFGNARDAWLHSLTGTRHALEVARFVAAGLSAAEELCLPLDDPQLWWALLLRVHQTGIGRRPLSAGLMPVQALDGHRVLGPPMDASFPPVPPDAEERVDRFLAYLREPMSVERTVHDALRAGLALIVDALESGVELHEIMTASGPMHDGPEDHAGVPTAAAAQAAADRLDPVLSDLGRPDQLVVKAPQARVAQRLAELPALALVLALALGVRTSTPRGRAIHEAIPWALGLLPPTPLMAVTDAILIAARTSDHNAGGMLARLLTLAEIGEPLTHDDSQFHGGLGLAFVGLAFDEGAKNARFTSHRVQKVDDVTAHALGVQLEAFEAKFGRPPRPNELVFFDVNADVPSSVDPDAFAVAQRTWFESIGVTELTIRAAELAEMPPPMTGRCPDVELQREWEAGVAAAARELGMDADEAADVVAGDIEEIVRANLLVQVAEAMADPRAGRAFVVSLAEVAVATPPGAERVPDAAPGVVGTHAMAESIFQHAAEVIGGELADGVADRARQFSQVWGGLELTKRVDKLSAWAAMAVPRIEWLDVPAAFCLVAAVLASGLEAERAP